MPTTINEQMKMRPRENSKMQNAPGEQWMTTAGDEWTASFLSLCGDDNDDDDDEDMTVSILYSVDSTQARPQLGKNNRLAREDVKTKKGIITVCSGVKKRSMMIIPMMIIMMMMMTMWEEAIFPTTPSHTKKPRNQESLRVFFHDPLPSLISISP